MEIAAKRWFFPFFVNRSYVFVNRRASHRNTVPETCQSGWRIQAANFWSLCLSDEASRQGDDAGCCGKRRMPPVFIPNGQTLNSSASTSTCSSPKLFPGWRKIIQQDGALRRTSKATQAFLTSNTPFWPAGLWPHCSLDLNPLDYGIWAHVEGKACVKIHKNVESLKRNITKVGVDKFADFVIGMCKAFRSHLQKCIDVGGYVFLVKSFWWFSQYSWTVISLCEFLTLCSNKLWS